MSNKAEEDWRVEDDARTIEAYATLCADKRRKKLAEDKLKKKRESINKIIGI